MSLCYKYRCAVCGSPSTSTRKDARLCSPTCRSKASRVAAQGEEYTPAGRPTTDTLHTTLAEHPDLLRQRLGARHPLQRLSEAPLCIGDGKSIWLIGCRLGAATQVAISELQESLREQQVGVLVCGSITKRLLAACRRRGIIPVTHEARWLTMPSTRKISAKPASHRRFRVAQRVGLTTTVTHRTATPPPLCTRVNAVASLVGAIPDETSLLNQPSEAFSRNCDRCTRCPANGDASWILYCASCRRPYCKSCMSKDAEGYWRCRRCAGKVKQADSPILPWIEEPISEQRARAKGDAKDARALIKVIRCACGWGVNSQLEQGIVECRCGRAFSLADAKRIVATVRPRGRSVGAKTKELVGAGAVRGGIGAVCKPHQTAGSTPTAVSASASTGNSLVPSPLGCR